MRSAAACTDAADKHLTPLHHKAAGQSCQIEIAPLIKRTFALFEIALEAER